MINYELIKYAGILLVGVVLSSIGQVLLKKSALIQYDSFIREYLNPRVISSYLLFFIATILSVIAYKKVPLSLGPLLEATSYIYVTIFGVKLFNEKINRKKIIALLLIIIGITVYSTVG